MTILDRDEFVYGDELPGFLAGAVALDKPPKPDEDDQNNEHVYRNVPMGLVEIAKATWDRPVECEDCNESDSTVALLARSHETRRKHRSGPANLLPGQRAIARHRAVQAVTLAYHHAAAVHYTQGIRRWNGIEHHRRPNHGHFPHWADCSGFDSWALWWALHESFRVSDVVNGVGWSGGFTGTMLGHGQPIARLAHWGDVVIYGDGWPGKHAAMHVGNGMVISFGSEAGPLFLPATYRPDLMARRRYI